MNKNLISIKHIEGSSDGQEGKLDLSNPLILTIKATEMRKTNIDFILFFRPGCEWVNGDVRKHALL